MNIDSLLDRCIPVPFSGCLIWMNATDTGGYGRVCIGHQRIDGAHRVAWQLTYGEIPPGQYVLHHCDVKPCINPLHLYLGDQKQNLRDAIERGQYGNAKITATIASLIRDEYSHGDISQAQIGNRYGLKQAAVSKIVTGRRWK